MSRSRHGDSEWREFERLIARIEADAGPSGLTVTSPDHIRCKLTGRMREVDASIRAKIGTTDMLVTVECRRRTKVQDITWIEQLVSKKLSIGADHTIAVSISGFSSDAQMAASRAGISLRKVSDLTVADVNPLLGLDLVVFWHKACAITGAGVRDHRADDTVVVEAGDLDYTLPADTDVFAPIFHDVDAGSSWSLNDIWHAVQESLNPYASIEKAAPPLYRTARIPYPGYVTVDTPQGPRRIGHVLLGMAMWIEPEFVSKAEALKVEYAGEEGALVHRVEFSSKRTQDWRVSLQTRADAGEDSEVRVGGNWPSPRA